MTQLDPRVDIILAGDSAASTGWALLPQVPAKAVVHVVVVPSSCHELGVLGVLGGRVPACPGRIPQIHHPPRDLVVGLALLGWFIFLRGGARGPRVDVASSMRGRARAGFRAASNRRFLRVRFGRVGLGLVAHGGPLLDRVDRVRVLTR